MNDLPRFKDTRAAHGRACVIVSDFAHVSGGAAKVAIESARGLAEAGHDVVFVHALTPVSDRLAHPRITCRQIEALEVWHMGSPLAAARQGIWNARAHDALRALLAEVPRDAVVHLHQWTKALSPSVIAAAAESGLAVVLTAHDYFSFCPVGGYYDFKAQQICTKPPMGAGCLLTACDRTSYAHKLVRAARQWHTNRTLSACRNLHVIHVSDAARQLAVPHLPDHAVHHTLANMMQARDLGPADLTDNSHVLYVGRLTPEKGVLQLAQAAREARCTVRFLGEGPLDAALPEFGPWVELAPWTDAAGVVAEMRSARAVAAPSLWLETGPMTVGEAMAQGVPALVSAGIGAASLVHDGQNGLLLAAGDVSAWASGLRRVADAGERSRLGARAYRDYWATPFDIARHVAGLEAVYAATAARPVAA